MSSIEDEINELAKLYEAEIPTLYLSLISGPHSADLRFGLREAFVRLRNPQPLTLQEIMQVGNTVEQARQIVQGRIL